MDVSKWTILFHLSSLLSSLSLSLSLSLSPSQTVLNSDLREDSKPPQSNDLELL